MPLQRAVTDVTLTSVRKLVLHRWAAVLLLVSRLIFGEVTHAMPQPDAPAAGAVALAGQEVAGQEVASQEVDECPDHSPEGESLTTQSDDSHDSHDATQDCCETGDCKCPCMHVPAAATAPPDMDLANLHQNQVIRRADGVAVNRLSVLFRPPA